MRLLLFSTALFCFTSPSVAQVSFLESGARIVLPSDAGYLLDSPTRVVIDLDGDWTYATDGGVRGTVRLPAVYTSAERVQFERTVEMTPEQLGSYTFHLVMLGAGHAVEASINGDFLTSHVGAYSTIDEPIGRSMLQPGGNNLVRISVNNNLDGKTTIPLRPEAWGSPHYGGISREIYLLGTPPLYIREAVPVADLSDNFASATITTRIRVEGVDTLVAPRPTGLEQSFGVISEVVDKLSGAVIARSRVVPLVRREKEWDVATAALSLSGPKLWTPETPDLYLLRTSLVRQLGKETGLVDQCDQPLGIRRVSISGGHILVNGRRQTLRGVTWYEDSPSRGSAMTNEDRERDIVQIKNLGANLIRFIGHPPHPYMLNLCDRYGLFAMVEMPVVEVPGPIMGSENFQELALAGLREMIGRDRGHPSVLAWGLGDEFASSSAGGKAFVGNLSRAAHAFDTRPVYFGAVGEGDSCTSFTDIAALSLGAQDIKEFRSATELWKSTHKGKPLIVVKFGAEVRSDNRNGYSDPLSQEAQARFFLQRLEILKTLDYDGGIVWSFNDWRGGRPSLTVHGGDPGLRSLGLVSREREKRLAYDAVRSAFQGERFSALPMGSHSSGAPIVFVLVGFVLLVGIAYFYNSSRRFRESLSRSLFSSYNFFVDVRDQRSVSPWHTALIGIVESLAISVALSSTLFRFRDSRVADQVMSYLIPDDGIKRAIVELVWTPMRFILIGGAAVFGSFLLLTIAILLLRLVMRARIQAYHAFTVSIWSGAPLLILIPLGMIMYRIMESPAYVMPVFAIIVLLTVFCALRLLRGVIILYDARAFKVYLWTFLAAGVAAFLLSVTTELFTAVPMYADFLSSTITHLR